jgi:hypothetical protein
MATPPITEHHTVSKRQLLRLSTYSTMPGTFPSIHAPSLRTPPGVAGSSMLLGHLGAAAIVRVGVDAVAFHMRNVRSRSRVRSVGRFVQRLLFEQ